jgi:hypothetical protein
MIELAGEEQRAGRKGRGGRRLRHAYRSPYRHEKQAEQSSVSELNFSPPFWEGERQAGDKRG